MIEPKVVVISRENEIEEGWRLVSPTAFPFDKNPFFEAPSIAAVRKAITYANAIVLRLSEPCLPGSILDELKWVSQYARIEIEAKNNQVLDRYANLRFAKQTIVPSIDGNSIAIDGKEQKTYLIDDGFSEIDYVSTKTNNLFQRASKVYLFDQDIDSVRLVKSKVGKDVPIVWIVNVLNYSKDVFVAAKSEAVELMVAVKTHNGVVVETAEQSLLKIVSLIGDQKCLAPIERLSDYGNVLYAPCGVVGKVALSDVPDEAYWCSGSEINKLDLKPSIEIKTAVEIATMDDFVDGHFDSSLTEEHNRYAFEAKKVNYRFILNPPRVNEDAVESAIYTPIKTEEKKWGQAQRINLLEMKKAIEAIYPSGGPLVALAEKLSSFTKSLKSMVSKCHYKHYYASLQDICKLLSSANEVVLTECSEIYSTIASANSDTKFFKFDDEIEGYRATIAEKTALIGQGIEVLSNKRRIEILNQKIDDLLKMKARFQQSASSSGAKNLQAFLSLCKDLLNGYAPKADLSQAESIGKVIGSKEDSKEAKLNVFVRKYLPLLKPYFSECLEIIERLVVIRIPEENQVIDQNGRSYLVIDEEKEFQQTKDIRAELHLGCLTGR